MKSKLFQRYPLQILSLLFLGLMVMILLLPSGAGLADGNQPTITATREPTATQERDENQSAPTPTLVPVVPTSLPEFPAVGTAVPPPTSVTGGLSFINRILLVFLAIVTVGVMAIIVYAIYYRTQQERYDE